MSASMPCPDPSLHRDTKLQEQASTAALYATGPSRKPQASDILDKDNKLSSKSAAMSLKHARPEDLPSYPSSGGVALNASTGAANLANTNHKSFEHWKPDPSSAAGKAALLAKDYKMAPLWQPEMSTAGSKAALLAHKDGGKLEWWTPEASAAGNSAATQAFKKSTLSPNVDYGYTPDGRKKALLAATKSVTASRARSGSLPAPAPPKYPDSANSAYNALNAATKANRKPSTRTQADDTYDSPALEESRIRHLSDKISREMFTDHPPVEIEVQEKKHQDALRASAVSMAKSMYDLQQKKEKEASTTMSPGNTAATAAVGRSATVAGQPDIRQQALQYIHLQEAAHKLAEERLAKMDPDGAARYREHYGYPLRSPRRKLSIKDRYRRRANSDTQQPQFSDSDDDDFRSRRIRNQMNQFNKEVETLDQQKRTSDRAALLAAAEKKVQAQMRTMDDKVYAETGKVSQAKQDEWEAKAREKATRNSVKRTENFGKADIGGGKFMEQSEIEAIAAARLKPTLDEISENAEKRRARDEEIRLDMEEKKRQELSERQREREVKMLQKQTRDQEKNTARQEKEQQKAAQKQEKAEQKAAAKQEKEAEKARKAEEKRAAKDEKRRSKDVKRDVVAATATSAAVHEDRAKSDATESPQESPKTSSDSAHTADENLSPVVSRSVTGEPVFRPSVERHITNISTSSSEAGDETTKSPTVPASVSPDKAAHKGTDGPIGTAPAIIAPSNDEAKTIDSPSGSSQNPKGISKLLGKLRRKSRSERDVEPGTLSPWTAKSRLSKDRKVDDVRSDNATAATETPSATVNPTDTDLAPLSAVEARDIADKHAGAAQASPSSFVRGAETKDEDEVSSLSDLSSDDEGARAKASSSSTGVLARDAGAGTGGEEVVEEKEKRKSFGLGIIQAFGMGKGKEADIKKGSVVDGEGRASLDGSAARSPVRGTRFQEEL
ncbi:chorismate synthase [Sphaceloma murrayae]|uniref:Chorismate synthase n=1 Tax=Sphaceloma murrayae TaxID=2082308 RepID=A0A2K1QRR7_9PEZI|nr:chorismate synthase [Sphaceloma murrayae]